ncbi:MAG: RND family transporter [Planctomycetaceae bacterium]
MVSQFYKSHGKTVLWGVALTFPLFYVQGNSMPSNNDIETWLPRDAAVRKTYETFKRDFGAEETILIALPAQSADPKLLAAVSTRLETLPGVRQCWTADRLRSAMQDLEVSKREIDQRLRGFVVSEDGKTLGVVVVLSKRGVQDRLKTVEQIRRQMRYCQLDGDSVSIAGSPVIVAELDRLGNSQNNQKFFLVTLLISLGLLYYSLRDWKLTAAILGVTVWAIQLTLSIVAWSGGEMNFILGALSVMVMVFTLAICVHMLHYYHAAAQDRDPLGGMLRRAWKPCCLATLTTTVGLLSLTVSDIGAVRDFGVAAAIGSIVALATGLAVMPAALAAWKPHAERAPGDDGWFTRSVHWLFDHKGRVTVVTGLLVAFTSVGLFRLQARIEPLDFLPPDNRVLTDVHRVEQSLMRLNSIEAVVDFGDDDSAFVDKLHRIRTIEAKIASHPSVSQTTSAAFFFPAELPDDTYKTAGLLQTAQDRWSESNDYITDGDRLWRISARIAISPDRPRKEIVAGLAERTRGDHVTFTGIAPLLEEAQQSIFDGFWQSFLTAFLIITAVMIVSLRSWKTGLVAMIPNLTPICIVFGILGWLSMPVDIGMMMTGSIALGIAVDGTFHFLVHYESRFRVSGDSSDASRDALLQTGAPILKAAMIAAIGMLALMLSNFVPTARFGYMMATLLMAALVGDLVLLPAILALRPKSRRTPKSDEDGDGTPLPPPPRKPTTIPAPHVHSGNVVPDAQSLQKTGT